MWKMKTKTIPVIVGTLGMIKKEKRKYAYEIPGNLFLAGIQKIVLDSTAHILRTKLSFSLYIYMYIYIYIYITVTLVCHSCNRAQTM